MKEKFKFFVERLSVLCPHMDSDFRRAMAAWMALNNYKLTTVDIKNAKSQVWLGGEEWGKKWIAQVTA